MVAFTPSSTSALAPVSAMPEKRAIKIGDTTYYFTEPVTVTATGAIMEMPSDNGTMLRLTTIIYRDAQNSASVFVNVDTNETQGGLCSGPLFEDNTPAALPTSHYKPLASPYRVEKGGSGGLRLVKANFRNTCCVITPATVALGLSIFAFTNAIVPCIYSKKSNLNHDAITYAIFPFVLILSCFSLLASVSCNSLCKGCCNRKYRLCCTLPITALACSIATISVVVAALKKTPCEP